MEDSFIALLFATDLINHNLNVWNCPHRISVDERVRELMGVAPFNMELIGQAVVAIQKSNPGGLKFFGEDFENCLSDDFQISKSVLHAATVYFRKGYRAIEFLNYCAFLTAVASYISAKHPFQVSKSMAECIANTLTAFIITGEFKKNGGWDELAEVAKNVKSGTRE